MFNPPVKENIIVKHTYNCKNRLYVYVNVWRAVKFMI